MKIPCIQWMSKFEEGLFGKIHIRGNWKQFLHSKCSAVGGKLEEGLRWMEASGKKPVHKLFELIS